MRVRYDSDWLRELALRAAAQDLFVALLLQRLEASEFTFVFTLGLNKQKPGELTVGHTYPPRLIEGRGCEPDHVEIEARIDVFALGQVRLAYPDYRFGVEEFLVHEMSHMFDIANGHYRLSDREAEKPAYDAQEDYRLQQGLGPLPPGSIPDYAR